MKIFRQRRCTWCPVWFVPSPRLKDRQRSCGRSDCKRRQKLFSHGRWKQRERELYRQGQRDWRTAHPGYWKTYRETHLIYVQRNRLQSRVRWSLAQQTLQKRIDILELTEITPEYWNFPRFAKQPRSLFPLLFAYGGWNERLEGGQKSQAP